MKCFSSGQAEERDREGEPQRLQRDSRARNEPGSRFRLPARISRSASPRSFLATTGRRIRRRSPHYDSLSSVQGLRHCHSLTFVSFKCLSNFVLKIN